MTIEEVRALPAVVPVAIYSRALGVSSDTVYDAIKRGDLKALHLGRRILLPLAPLIRALELSPIEEASSSEALPVDDG
jgi:excisionase family DNA binding protein